MLTLVYDTHGNSKSGVTTGEMMRLSTTSHWLTGFPVHGFSKFIGSSVLFIMTPCCPMENQGTAKFKKCSQY